MEKSEKIHWCEDWIKATFTKLPRGITGIECNLFFELAAKRGLYEAGSIGSEMSTALSNLIDVGFIETSATTDAKGDVRYHYFSISEYEKWRPVALTLDRPATDYRGKSHGYANNR